MGHRTEYLETKTLRLKTLSPVHIRAGEGSKEYGQGFIRLNSDFIYLIDTPSLQRELYNAGGLGAVQVFADYFSNTNSEKNIIDVLNKIKKKFGFDYEKNIKKISKGIIPTPKGNLLMKSALGQHLIPGSSIKGAIKTAVLYNILNNAESLKDLDVFVEKKIGEYRRSVDKHKFKETFGKELLVDNFQSNEPKEEIDNLLRQPSGEGSFKDFFRAIKIKDAMIEKSDGDKSKYGTITDLKPNENKIIITTLNNEKLLSSIENLPSNKSIQLGQKVKVESAEKIKGEVIATRVEFIEDYVISNVEFHNVMIMSLNKELQTYEFYQFRKEESQHGKKAIDNRIQCFEGDAQVTISLDHSILDSFYKQCKLHPPFKDISSLLNLCKTFADRQWQEEQNYLTNEIQNGQVNLDSIKKYYDDNNGKATLRIGWGTGMLGTTVDLLLKRERRKELRNKVIAVQKPGQLNDWPLPAPKSRRFVLDEHEKPLAPLGWIQLLER